MSSATTDRVHEDDERRLKAFLSTLCDANACLEVVQNMDVHVARTEFLLGALLRSASFSSASRVLHVANRQSGLFVAGVRGLLDASTAAAVVSVSGRQSVVDVVNEVLVANAPRDAGTAAPVQLVESRILSADDLDAILAPLLAGAAPPPLVVLDLFSGVGLGDGALRVAAFLHQRVKKGLAPLKIFPQRMRLMAVAVDLTVKSKIGFDLSEFETLKASLGWVPTPLDELDFTLMSEPIELFDLAFDSPPSLPRKASVSAVAAKQCGTITGLVVWCVLESGDDKHATLDLKAKSNRMACVFGLREPIVVTDAHEAEFVVEASLSTTMLFINASSSERSRGVRAARAQRRAPPVPQWQWAMMGDQHRNAVYDAALRRCMLMRDQRPHVLEIGRTSGMLSMMAARAGAERVVCVEPTAHMAQLARDVVAANGLAGQIDVAAVHSAALPVPARPFDVLVTEIFDSQLLGEQILPTVADLQRRGLLAPNATIIPRGAVVYAQLVQLDDFSRVKLSLPDGTKRSVDASALSQFLRACPELSFNGIRLEHTHNVAVLSEVFSPFVFDFANAGALLEPRDCVMRVPIRRSGSFNAVVFHFHLQMDGEARLSTGPGASRAWCQSVQHMSVPLPVTAGQPIDIACLHDSQRFVFVDADQRSGPPGGPVAQEKPKWLARLQNRERLARSLGSSELGIAPGTRPPVAVLAMLRSMAVRATDSGFDDDIVHNLLQNALTWSL
jgi:predicted RNA methylase